MSPVAKKLILDCVAIIAWPFRIIPGNIRRGVIFVLMLFESRIGRPVTALKSLFMLQDKLELLINERAMAVNDGEHPKHRLMNYHDFFIDKISRGSHVLDIGCGYGAVSRSIAKRVEGVRVTGIENNRARFFQAIASENPANLEFIFGEAPQDIPDATYDYIVLSNILEHIKDRVVFLKHLVDKTQPISILIRVPLFERSWQVPMRKELGISYFSDPTHIIEHTLPEFELEITSAGLKIVDRITIWGEIWADCRPITDG